MSLFFVTINPSDCVLAATLNFKFFSTKFEVLHVGTCVSNSYNACIQEYYTFTLIIAQNYY